MKKKSKAQLDLERIEASLKRAEMERKRTEQDEIFTVLELLAFNRLLLSSG